MRLQITLDDDLVEQLDKRVGRRQRSSFIANAVGVALSDEQRWEDIDAGLGALADSGHEWDSDLAGWVRTQRRSDTARVG